MKQPKKRPSGPSGRTRTYAERKASGRPMVAFTLSEETAAAIADAAREEGISRGELVTRAVDEYIRTAKTR